MKRRRFLQIGSNLFGGIILGGSITPAYSRVFAQFTPNNLTCPSHYMFMSPSHVHEDFANGNLGSVKPSDLHDLAHDLRSHTSSLITDIDCSNFPSANHSYILRDYCDTHHHITLIAKNQGMTITKKTSHEDLISKLTELRNLDILSSPSSNMSSASKYLRGPVPHGFKAPDYKSGIGCESYPR